MAKKDIYFAAPGDEVKISSPGSGRYVRQEPFDVKLSDKIEYFDSDLSYELTGYRPLTEEKGLNFDPAWFNEAARTKLKYGKYTDYPEGSKRYMDFWIREKNRCEFGFEAHGYRLTGDNYFFLNYYRMPVAGNESHGVTYSDSFPNFFAKQYEYFHYVEMCEKLGKDVVALKARGVGFSEIAACLGVRPYITTAQYRSLYTAYDKRYLSAVLRKCWTQLNYCDTETENAFKRLRQRYNTDLHKRASILDAGRVETGHKAEIEGIVASDPANIRGDRVRRLFFEEFGSNPKGLVSFIQGEALVKVLSKRVGTKFAWGTGGDSGPALEGLSLLFNNPDAHDILPYRHRYTADGREAMTGYFIPCYEIVTENPSFMDYRGVAYKEKTKGYYLDERSKKDAKTLITYASEYCFTPEEALIREGENQFNAVLLAEQMANIKIHKTVPKPEIVDMIWDLSCKVPDTVKVIPTGTGKIEIYEHPQMDANNQPFSNLYVGGIDSIDFGKDDSSDLNKDQSDFCLVIKKRVLGQSDPMYVCVYKDRPNDIRTAYEKAAMILKYYNAKALVENTRISITTHFRNKKREGMLFARPKATLPDIKMGKSKMLGVPATEAVIRHYLDLINNFINDYWHTIYSEEILDQLLRYSYEKKRKFDIVAAMGMAELADEELFTTTPRSMQRIKPSEFNIGYYYDEYGIKRYGRKPSWV